MFLIRGMVLLTLFLLASPSFAAITEVGGGTQRTSGSCTAANDCSVAFPGNVVAGSLLVVGGAAADAHAGGPTLAITDTIGTTYTIKLCTVVDDATTFSAPFIAYGFAPSSAANTVLVDPTGTGTISKISFGIDEFTGVHATPLDVDISSTIHAGSTTPSDSLNTITANDLILALEAQYGTTTITPNVALTQIGEQQGTQSGYNFAFRLVTTAQEYIPDWTLGTSSEWTACTLAIKEAVSTRRPIPPIFLQ